MNEPPWQPDRRIQPPGDTGYWGQGMQQQWTHQQFAQGQPAKPRRNGWKWLLGAVALVAVIGITVGVTLSVSNDRGSNGGTPPASSPTVDNHTAPDVASSDDTGPIKVITQDPSCELQRPILNARVAAQENGWNERDSSVPAEEWTPQIRAQYEEVAQAMRKAADRLESVVEITPHRIVRELYEQMIVYSRAYADSIPNYTAQDDYLAQVATTAGDVIANICAAIAYGSAAERGPLVAPLPAPDRVEPVVNIADRERFLIEPNPVCDDYDTAWAQFSGDSAAWLSIPSDIPASDWTPEQRAVNEAVAPVMLRFSNQVQSVGESSGNAVLRDFAQLAAQYRRAYVEALPTYVPADNFLATVALRAGGVIYAACKAVAR